MKPMSVRAQWRLSAAAFALTVAIVVWYAVRPDDAAAAFLLHLAWALWAVLPPVWFLWEWHLFEGDASSPAFATLKYSHDLASKVWLGGLTVLTALHVKPDWFG